MLIQHPVPHSLLLLLILQQVSFQRRTLTAIHHRSVKVRGLSSHLRFADIVLEGTDAVVSILKGKGRGVELVGKLVVGGFHGSTGSFGLGSVCRLVCGGILLVSAVLLQGLLWGVTNCGERSQAERDRASGRQT